MSLIMDESGLYIMSLNMLLFADNIESSVIVPEAIWEMAQALSHGTFLTASAA